MINSSTGIPERDDPDDREHQRDHPEAARAGADRGQPVGALLTHVSRGVAAPTVKVAHAHDSVQADTIRVDRVAGRASRAAGRIAPLSSDARYVVPADPPAPAARQSRAARPRTRDAADAGGVHLPDVRRPRRRPPRADPGDARDRPPVDRPRGPGGRGGARPRDPGGAAVRPARRQGRARHRRLRRRGDRPARHAGDQGRASGAPGDHRSVPVRVHQPRPLRRGP